MKIELIEFYPIEFQPAKNNIKGTLHVYLCDENMDLRGVYISKKKNTWYVHLPTSKGVDDKGNEVRFPIINFLDDNKNKELIKTIKEQAKNFVENYINEFQNTIQNKINRNGEKIKKAA